MKTSVHRLSVKSVALASIVLICLLSFGVLAGCGGLSDAKNLKAYTFGQDSCPSINSIVGERDVTNVETGFDNDVDYQIYTYTSDSPFDDVLAYEEALEADGWILNEDWEMQPSSGLVVMLKESTEKPDSLLGVYLEYNTSEYTLDIRRGPGSLTIDQ
ncbi:MAG: hypothetical protein LBL23_00220 [Coriobacteriales bacterium]|jgi:hypothetical protein|nr:hypothetical protein [Coriobacteriales bacterium]